MKEINLTQNKKALVDDDDYDRINSLKWRTEKVVKSYGIVYYACRTTSKGTSGKRGYEFMHTLIIDVPSKYLKIDHIDGNGLNNCKSNLRIVTTSQNSMNARKAAKTSSAYKGVCFHKRERKWYAYIKQDYKLISLGYFHEEIVAAKAYNEKAKELFGEFANLNVFE